MAFATSKRIRNFCGLGSERKERKDATNGAPGLTTRNKDATNRALERKEESKQLAPRHGASNSSRLASCILSLKPKKGNSEKGTKRSNSISSSINLEL